LLSGGDTFTVKKSVYLDGCFEADIVITRVSSTTSDTNHTNSYEQTKNTTENSKQSGKNSGSSETSDVPMVKIKQEKGLEREGDSKSTSGVKIKSEFKTKIKSEFKTPATTATNVTRSDEESKSELNAADNPSEEKGNEEDATRQEEEEEERKRSERISEGSKIASNRNIVYNIEIDGPSHTLPSKQRLSRRRDQHLQEACGVQIARISLLKPTGEWLESGEYEAMVRGVLVGWGMLRSLSVYV
jgi:hypothetical protein